MDLGPMEVGLIVLAILLLFGYKKLPDASRSIGRSLRIFKGEMQGMKDDDVADLRSADAAATGPVRGEVLPAASSAAHAEDRLEEEARAAEARAAELRAQAARVPTQ